MQLHPPRSLRVRSFSSGTLLQTVSLPIQINSPCAPDIQAQPKYIQGVVTIVLIAAVTTPMALAPYIPGLRSRLAPSTVSKIQKLAGVLVGQSALICISSTLQQMSKPPIIPDRIVQYGNAYGVDTVLDDTRSKYNPLESGIEVSIVVVFVWGLSTIYSRAVMKFEESRHVSDSDATGSTPPSKLLPFYSSFCMPYVSSLLCAWISYVS
jgi:hypothetical protein